MWTGGTARVPTSVRPWVQIPALPKAKKCELGVFWLTLVVSLNDQLGVKGCDASVIFFQGARCKYETRKSTPIHCAPLVPLWLLAWTVDCRSGSWRQISLGGPMQPSDSHHLPTVCSPTGHCGPLIQRGLDSLWESFQHSNLRLPHHLPCQVECRQAA
jgi:hypothetical protein